MANPEILNDSNKDLIKENLKELKDQIKPWIVNFENESRDKKYNIYSYTLVQWWTRWWIKNKYINQIWPWVEWTQFTDVNWNEIKKDKFDAWEKVYLRVPKDSKEQKENKNIPWKVEFIWNKKDKEKRNWKFYSYTFSQWGTIWWVMNKFESQLWMSTDYYKFCDKNGKKLTKEYFNKWETIYYKAPNTDIIDPTPEMTINEIMKLSNNDILQILKFESWDKNIKYVTHTDKKWRYIIVNQKKLYYEFSNFKENTPYINVEAHESATNVYGFAIAVKKWGKYQWIYCWYDGKIYRWELSYDGMFLSPKE